MDQPHYIIPSWQDYQHYKDRDPPWIKLHFSLLTSQTWVMLADASRLFMLACIPILELIPKASLAAILIVVGIKLAHPKEFIHMYKIGKEQLIIFVVTILCTLGIDLLVGIGAGILTKLIINAYYSKSLINKKKNINNLLTNVILSC